MRDSSDSARKLAEIRRDIDALSDSIFRALAERKKYGFNSAMYFGIGSDNEHFDFYKRIIRMLCAKDSKARMTPEIRAIDSIALAVLRQRLLIGAKAIMLKRKNGMPVRNPLREKELCADARKIAEKYGIDAKTGEEIMKTIVRKTIAMLES